MLENLLNLVKEHAGDAIINNPAIPNERNDEAISAASSSIFDTLKNAASGGNLSDIMSLFNGGSQAASSNPLASSMQSGLVQNLMHKFGLDQGVAGGIAASLIPSVLGKLVHKTNDPNDSSFNLQNILSTVGGGNLDIASLIGQFTGGGNQQQQQNSGGGILDTIKGLFGK